MALKKSVEIAINKQINAEVFSEYLYLSMSAYFERKNLKGMAGWMRAQAQEEHKHAMKFFDYVNDRGGTVVLEQIDKPKATFTSPLNAFQEAYNHELKVTELINNIMDIAKKESDHATQSFLQWYVDEQVEEESTADEVVQNLKLVKEDASGLFIIDQKLAARVPAIDTPVTGPGAQ